jgi:hypothetical protein
MKNIHILKTDKPSRLQLFEGINEFEFELCSKDSFFNKGVHIYITSDEEIKDIRPHKGKWHLEKENILNKFPDYLTDLSECKLVIMTTDQDLIKDGVQAIDDEFLEWFVKNPSCEYVEVLFSYKSVNELPISYYRIVIPKKEPKQERIGDFIKRESTSVNESMGIIKGANWQAERMYSEEEVIDFLQEMNDWPTTFEGKIDIREWFNQFKKK